MGRACSEIPDNDVEEFSDFEECGDGSLSATSEVDPWNLPEELPAPMGNQDGKGNDVGAMDSQGFYPNSAYGWDPKPFGRCQSPKRPERDNSKMADNGGKVFRDVHEVENHMARLQLDFRKLSTDSNNRLDRIQQLLHAPGWGFQPTGLQDPQADNQRDAKHPDPVPSTQCQGPTWRPWEARSTKTRTGFFTILHQSLWIASFEFIK